jgi:hypothetical protein
LQNRCQTNRAADMRERNPLGDEQRFLWRDHLGARWIPRGVCEAASAGQVATLAQAGASPRLARMAVPRRELSSPGGGLGRRQPPGPSQPGFAGLVPHFFTVSRGFMGPTYVSRNPA